MGVGGGGGGKQTKRLDVHISHTKTTSSFSDTSSCRTNDAAAAEYVCAAVPRSLTLQHQCRLLVRRMLASSGLGFRVALSCLGLPQRVQNYISLGEDLSDQSLIFKV